MIRGAAGNKAYFFYISNGVTVEQRKIKRDFAVFYMRAECPPNGVRLFKNLFEHIVSHTVFSVITAADIEHRQLLFNGFAVKVIKRRAVRAQHSRLTVVEVNRLFCMLRNSRNIGRRNRLVFSDADDKRTEASDRNNRIRFVDTHKRRGKGSFKPLCRIKHRFQEASSVILLNKVNYRLRVRIAFKHVSFVQKLCLERFVIFYYAVVNYGKVPVLTQMRVSVSFRGRSVSCPAGVTDSDGAVKRRGVVFCFKLGNSFCGFAGSYHAVTHHRKSG